MKTPTDESPREIEIEEIREWHKLGGMYFKSAKKTSEFDVKRFHELSDKLIPIDTTQMLFDYIDKLQSRLEKCEGLLLEASVNYELSPAFKETLRKYFAEVEGE